MITYIIFALLLIFAVIATHRITKSSTLKSVSILSTIFQDTCPDCNKHSIQFTATAGVSGLGTIAQTSECLNCDEEYLESAQFVVVNERVNS